MIKKIYLCSMLLAILTLDACKESNKTPSQPPQKEVNSDKKAALQCIMSRASCRVFQHKEVEKETIETLLRAAMAAPSALNAQPWHFIVINDHEILKQLATPSPHTGFLEQAPLAIALCGDMTKKANAIEGAYWEHDIAAATENLLIAAHALGLGATWTGSYPVEKRMEVDRKVLQLPDHIIPISIVAIGYPAMEPQAKDKWNPDNISYNTYEKK
jgi:nitroreductase